VEIQPVLGEVANASPVLKYIHWMVNVQRKVWGSCGGEEASGYSTRV